MPYRPEAANRQTPEYICAPKNLFSLGSEAAPAIGLPIKTPNDDAAHAMPMRVPTTFMLGLNSATADAGSTAIGPEKRPCRKLIR